MRAIVAIVLFVASGFANATGTICFLQSEYVSGMNRICIYSCISGTRAITVSAVALCPISIRE